MVRGVVADINAIDTLRGLETHIVVAWLVVLAETELGGWGKKSLHLLLYQTNKGSG